LSIDPGNYIGGDSEKFSTGAEPECLGAEVPQLSSGAKPRPGVCSQRLKHNAKLIFNALLQKI